MQLTICHWGFYLHLFFKYLEDAKINKMPYEVCMLGKLRQYGQDTVLQLHYTLEKWARVWLHCTTLHAAASVFKGETRK